MISLEELKRRAGSEKVDLSIIEKDYCLGWFLKGISNNEALKGSLAFKGGTALRKIYFADYRFSEDLDFTSIVDFSGDELEKELINVCSQITAESGITYELALFKQTRSEVSEPAWEYRVDFIGPRSEIRQPRRIHLDITSFEVIVDSLEEKGIIHKYSDTFYAKINVYSIEEIASEKLRTLKQRCYPRDVYDVWYILKNAPVDRGKLNEMLRRKCEYKGVDLKGKDDLIVAINQKDLKSHWVNSIARQVSDLPEFSQVVEELEELIDMYL